MKDFQKLLTDLKGREHAAAALRKELTDVLGALVNASNETWGTAAEDLTWWGADGRRAPLEDAFALGADSVGRVGLSWAVPDLADDTKYAAEIVVSRVAGGGDFLVRVEGDDEPLVVPPGNAGQANEADFARRVTAALRARRGL